MNLSDCLRSESIYKAKLCDLCDLFYHQKVERSTSQKLVMRIGEGKINKNKNIFGMVMRHVDIRSYTISSLGLWLLARFKKTSEMNDYNFKDNDS